MRHVRSGPPLSHISALRRDQPQCLAASIPCKPPIRWPCHQGNPDSDGTMSPATGTQDFSRALPSERRARGFTSVAKRERGARTREHTTDRLLVPESDPPIGAHIITQRHSYTRHGIYAGVGRVVHHAGLSRGVRRGPVQEISLSRFAAGHRVSVRSDLAPKFEGREVARRARSRIGEANYRLFTNNCEHFCEWCLRGQHRSYQIDAWLALSSRSLHLTRRLIVELLSLAGRTVGRSTQMSAARATDQRSA